MASPIINAVRQRTDLRESVLYTAQEIAHRASIYGVARVSYRYLAQKCHCSRQTIIAHVKKLEALRILRKRVTRIRGSAWCEWNLYTFTLPWEKGPLRMPPAHTCNSQNSGPKFPAPEEEEKSVALRDEITALERGLRLFTQPGTEAHESTVAEIARLRALLHTGEDA